MKSKAFEAEFAKLWRAFQKSTPQTYPFISLKLVSFVYGPDLPEKAFLDVDSLRAWYQVVRLCWMRDSLRAGDFWRDILPSNENKLALSNLLLEARATGLRRIQKRIFREKDGPARYVPINTYHELDKWCDFMFELLEDDEQEIPEERNVLTIRYDKGVPYRENAKREEKIKQNPADRWVIETTHNWMSHLVKGEPNTIRPDDDWVLVVWSNLVDTTQGIPDVCTCLFIDAEPQPKTPSHEILDDMISSTWKIMRKLGLPCREEPRVKNIPQVRKHLDSVKRFCHKQKRTLDLSKTEGHHRNSSTLTMKRNLSLIKLTLCGPGDVAKEVEIAKEVISEWNLRHAETYGFWVKDQHWLTDTYPSLGDRPQGVVNKQIIDDSDVLVAIFWSRFGTSTGIADSGTEEEIRRGVTLDKKVLVYFSDLEPLPPTADSNQIERVSKFRRDIQPLGLCWKFRSRSQFRSLFSNHLALLLNQLKVGSGSVKTRPRRSNNTIQRSKGSGNVQISGNGNTVVFNQRPAVIKNLVEKPLGAITPGEKLRVTKWIEELAEGEVGITRKQAFGMWWKRLYNRFNVSRYGELRSSQISEIEEWQTQQKRIQKTQLSVKAPEISRNFRIRAIKSAMQTMGKTNEQYYPELSHCLRIKKPFSSLTDLTNNDLERVYRMVLRQQREG